MANFQFPSVQPKLYTLISFYEYSRPRPNSDTQLKLNSQIRLPLPVELSDSYATRLNSPDLDVAASVFGGAVDGGGLADSFVNAVRSRDSGGIINKIISGAQAITALSPTSSDTGLGRVSQQSLGVVRNPHTSTIFDGMNLRAHQLQFRVSPQNKNDAAAIKNIIDHIKLRMHPTLEGGGFALGYPDIVTVKYVGLDSKTAPMIRRSFIETFTPNYSAQGFAAFFKGDGEGASPIDMSLAIALRELDIVTRESIANPNFYFNSSGAVEAAANRSLNRTNNSGRLIGPV